jgi:methyl-accepting chemotaxis protein
MKSGMTIEKKLFAAFGTLLVLTVGMGAYALMSVGSLGKTTGTLVNGNAKRQSLAGDINRVSTELISQERGIILRAYMKDRAVMDQYNDVRQKAAEHMRKSMADLAALADTPAVQQMLRDSVNDLDKLDEQHSQMWRMVTSGKLEEATELNRASLMPLAVRINNLGQKLADSESQAMASAATDAEAAVAHSRWIMMCILTICLAVSALAMMTVHRIVVALRKIVAELNNGGDQVASASGQIAASSQSLSQGSSEQAASLEEISASMEEMTAMARRNSENSAEASGMMTEAAVLVARSNEALQDMVLSMSAIKSSSEKVFKIIKTIDEIAFQTNILALNAAVEAARAGEAGMGFAVVAEEVRNLAQRSAVAAKDTAALIEEAINNSNQGATKLDLVAGSIGAITESAQKVKGLVEEVSESSKQQTVGINQTSTAVTQVSKVTQTAAASAEESAAASEELSAQAQTMHDLVMVLSVMVDGHEPRQSREATKRSQTYTAPRVETKPVSFGAKRVEGTTNRVDDDPFPMDTVETGSFRSF